MMDSTLPAPDPHFNAPHGVSVEEALDQLFKRRIGILDGAMGTMIQRYKLQEEDFRMDHPVLKNHSSDLKGNNDLLVLTRPDVIGEIHRQYLDAGADIFETNTFSGTTIAQADYGLEHLVREINLEAARLAVKVRDEFTAETGKRAFVAGAIGPMNRTLSLSPDVNDPGFRAVNFEQVCKAYKEQVAALMEGGVDTLLVETIFDTLNCKAALFAIQEYFDEIGRRVPIQISVTITDKSGRTLSGQTIEAFWYSVRHAKPFSVGINCALGAEDMRPYIAELSNLADCYVSCYPNAGLPNPLSDTGYDQTPEITGGLLEDFARNGWLNLVGGCCGTTPAHIAATAKAVSKFPPRPVPLVPRVTRLSGLEGLVFAGNG